MAENTIEELNEQIKALKEVNSELAGKLKESLFSEYRYLLEMIPGIVYKTDPLGNFTYVSPSVKTLGYKPDELIGRHFSLLIHPDDISKVSRDMVLPRYTGINTGDESAPKLFDERRSGSRGTFGLEVRIVSGNENRVSEKNSVNAKVDAFGQYDKNIRDQNKNFLGTLGVVKLEYHATPLSSARKHPSEDMETLMNLVPDIIYKIDTEGRFTYVNDAVKRLGYSPEELIGRHFSEIMEMDVARQVSRENVLKGLKGVATGDARAPKLFDERRTGARKTTQLEIPLHHKEAQKNDINSIVAEVTASGFYQKSPDEDERCFMGTVGIIRDITERKKAEEKLHLLGTAIEQSNEIVMITDLEGRIQYINPAFEKVTGYSREEIIGLTPGFLSVSNDKTDKKTQLEIWEIISNGGIWKGNFTNRKKDGSQYMESATIFPVKDLNGDTTNYAKVARDITIEREMEIQYNQSQKMEAIGRLAGGIAHDFNNLLTGIIGNTELASARMAPGDPLLKYINEISKIADRSTDLIRQLLAFSRRDILSPRRFDINDVIKEMERMLSRIIGENIQLITYLEPTVSCVKMDPGKLEQIIVNLTVNARDAMPKGGKLILKTCMEDIEEEYASCNKDVKIGRYVKLEISDTGIGFDEKTKAHIFEPFFTTKEKGKGTGLGLTTVYGIVANAGGHISVYSEKYMGTSFRIYLPSDPGESESIEIKHNMEKSLSKGTETILVVEDEKTIRTFLNPVFSEAGYKAFFASNAEEALMMLNSVTPQLLLTDIVLPDINGRELALKIEKILPGIKTLYMSGYSEEVIAHYAILEQGLNFIGKPFKISEILHKVRTVLDQPR